MTRKQVRAILEDSELVSMARSHFDEESTELMVDELVEQLADEPIKDDEHVIE
jgi:predicted house-cleaning noncanonical NTP pyrophosphatase (MazG superfamily)